MTREEIEELKGLAASMGLYDDKNPCKRAVVLGKAIKALEQEPTTKNDLVTLTFSKGTLKYSCKDYVVYKKDWLRSHYGAEIDIMFGDSQYKEPTTKNGG